MTSAETRYVVGHTADIAPDLLERARALLWTVFDGDISEQDWDHSLGGVHVIALEGDEVVGHASVIQRRLLMGGRSVRTGYVEGVGVRPDRQRMGIGNALMDRIERIIRAADDIGALGATDEAVPMYSKRGWRQWQGPLSAMTPDGIIDTAEEAGGVFVLDPPTRPVDVTIPLTCDWRDGDVW